MPDAVPTDPPPEESNPPAEEAPPGDGGDGGEVSAILDEIRMLEMEYTRLIAEYDQRMATANELWGSIAAADTAYNTAKVHRDLAANELETARGQLTTAENALCELHGDPNMDMAGNEYQAAFNAVMTASTNVTFYEGKYNGLVGLTDQLYQQKQNFEDDREIALCEAFAALGDAQRVSDRIKLLQKAI